MKASQARETASARDNIDKAMINCDTNELKQVEEALEKEKREILERREARRKSLANRRVSFAPEATLHTWDIVELAEDATTSSEATNSTRRASSASTLQSGTITGNQAILSASTFSDPPSTPVRHDIQVSASPTEQNGIHKENNSNDQSIPIEELESFSSPGDSIISEGSRRSIGHDTDIDLSEDSDEDNDSLEDDTEIRAIDYAESMHSDSSDQTGTTSSSAQLDHSLRRAVIQAGNQDLTFADDVTMDIVDDDTGLIPFPGTINTEIAAESTGKENAKPTSTSGEHIQYQDKSDETTEISMDMTMMIGGIVKNDTGSPNKGKRKSIASTKRRSLARRRSSVDSSILADETMDFVTTYGGIQTTSLIAQSADLEEQDISMDITRAIGNVLYPSVAVELENDDTEQDLSMDLTKAIGVISSTSRSTRSSKIAHKKSTDLTMPNGHSLSPLTEYTEPSENITFNMDLTTAMGGILNEKFDETVGMDITKAIGSILPKDLQANSKLVAKQLMEEEADHGQLTRSPFTQNKVQEGPELTAKSDAHLRSPSRTPNYLNLTRAASARQNTPTKTPGTPSRHLTPQPNRPLTPCKTPPNANISMRKTSPKRLFKKGVSKSPKFVTPSLSTSKDILNSQNLPLVILTPVFRRVSGVGIDQIGIGSPIAAAKLDRRASIGDSTPNFVPSGGKCIRFEDPRTIELELDRERAEEEYRESGLGVMEREVNDEGLDQGSTSALRHMIKSLTPKKNKFKGRKSLAPSAKGILGKRPLELDDEEDEDATPKRLKGNRSPVKSIHLPGPQKDTTLRLGTAPRFTLPGTTIAPVTIEASVSAITPRDHGRFKDAEVVGIGATPPASFDEQIQGIQPEISIAEDVQISLQDFLNLTNIRFMDLTTTKRRHTVATEDNKDESKKNSTGSSLADCVVAGVCTIPMLDLFQHSCRELKKYIAEGRNVVREIEKDTFEENPALFREYMAAAPDVRAIMDNQFKNIKVHARGESKATWYEWRSKLFEGLKSGLVSIHEGLLQDDKFLGDQEELLHGTIPSLIAKHTLLQEEATNLQSQADELANCDQEELRSVRKSLIQREQDIVEKKRLLVELQAELESNKIAVVEAEERKIEVIAEIKEAERVTNENRGWTYEEVKLLKGESRYNPHSRLY